MLTVCTDRTGASANEPENPGRAYHQSYVNPIPAPAAAGDFSADMPRIFDFDGTDLAPGEIVIASREGWFASGATDIFSYDPHG